MTDDKKAVKVSPKFNFPDADTIMESADGVQFLLHRKNLETHTKTLTGSSHNGNVTKLTESAEVLEILFQNVYPWRQPVLSGLSFKGVLSVADAVQKYQIFSAINSCEYELKKRIEEDPLALLVHALRFYRGYEGTTLLDEVACVLSRRKQTYVIVSRIAAESLSVSYVVKWMEYATKWDDLFRAVRDRLNTIPLHPDCYTNSLLCSNCRNCIITWIHDLQELTSIAALEEALDNPQFQKQNPLQTHDRCTYCKFNECKHRAPLVTLFRERLLMIPKFSTLM